MKSPSIVDEAVAIRLDSVVSPDTFSVELIVVAPFSVVFPFVVRVPSSSVALLT